MKSVLVALGSFGVLALVACGGASGEDLTAQRADRVVLDVRCAADTDCPTGFECEVETEHGTSTSFCKSHEGDAAAPAASTSACPAGFEQEVEHGGTFCKPHGSASSTDGGAATGAIACTSNADCGAGLECETEIEGGVTTSSCKAHGGKGK